MDILLGLGSNDEGTQLNMFIVLYSEAICKNVFDKIIVNKMNEWMK